MKERATHVFEADAKRNQHSQSFETWWYNEGSCPPKCDDDTEEHCKRQCAIAWSNGDSTARQEEQILSSGNRKRIEELQAELERFRVAHIANTNLRECAEKQSAELQRQNAELLEALKQYGFHLLRCPASDGLLNCECGLEKAIAGGK